MIATLPREILLPRRVEFPAWVKRLGDPLRMFGHGAMGQGVFAQAMGGITTVPTWTPLDLPTGLKLAVKSDGVLWQDAARTTAATALNDPIGSWDDYSANANHAQAALTARPLLKPNIQNGKPGILFDGSNDILETIANLPGGSGNYYLFVALKSISTSSNQIFNWGNGNNKQAVGLKIESGNLLNWWYAGDLNSGDPLGTSAARVECSFNGTTREIFLNDVSVGSDTPTGKNTTASHGWIGQTMPSIAVSEFINAYFFELLLWCDVTLAAGDLTNIRGYMSDRWA